MTHEKSGGSGDSEGIKNKDTGVFQSIYAALRENRIPEKARRISDDTYHELDPIIQQLTDDVIEKRANDKYVSMLSESEKDYVVQWVEEWLDTREDEKRRSGR